ncbi:PCRF domain-containing protein [Patescibacteria group bacterium]|nr:PCRF domain-containing protein [Patescibacteria group bacterium]
MDLSRSQIDKDYQNLIEELSDPEIVSDLERFEHLSRRKSQLELIITKMVVIEEIEKQISENNSIIAAGEDKELLSLASEEQNILGERKRLLETELEALVKEQTESKTPTLKTAAIIEIRAGVGGDEAALFAQDLFQMYSGYARSQGWQETVLDSSPTGLGGLKEIVFELAPSSKKGENNDVFGLMKYEAGVHRVQRIPDTEKSGRVHTSTITIAVLMKPKQVKDLKINPSDLKIDFFNATGPGGQNVNKRKTAVRVSHIPSGIVIASRTERNQLQNKENALAILAAKLLDQQQFKEEFKVAGTRKSQIGQAKRSEKIRTYNFPQDRVTDHRIKKSWHHLEEILKGRLEPIINELQESFAFEEN